MGMFSELEVWLGGLSIKIIGYLGWWKESPADTVSLDGKMVSIFDCDLLGVWSGYFQNIRFVYGRPAI